MQKIDISIVIVNYNVRQLLIICLQSLIKHKQDLALEIIVVDNASSDNSTETISKEFPDVILIKNKKNIGFPAANNQAFKIAKGEYIFMLNPDTEIIDDSVLQLLQFLVHHKEIVLVAPKLLNSDYTYQQSVWKFPKKRYIIAEMLHLNTLVKDKFYPNLSMTSATETESMSGAALLFRKELLDTIGLLDENLFWIEDIDYCYRIHQAGLKIVFYPKTTIVHHIGQSAKNNYTVSISNQIFNKIKFFKKHHSFISTFIIIFISFINVLIRSFAFLLLSPFNIIYLKKSKAYFYTLSRVFNPPSF